MCLRPQDSRLGCLAVWLVTIHLDARNVEESRMSIVS